MNAEEIKKQIQEIGQLADKIVAGKVVGPQEVHVISNKLDTVLAQMGIYPRYFKRLS